MEKVLINTYVISEFLPVRANCSDNSRSRLISRRYISDVCDSKSSEFKSPYPHFEYILNKSNISNFISLIILKEIVKVQPQN